MPSPRGVRLGPVTLGGHEHSVYSSEDRMGARSQNSEHMPGPGGAPSRTADPSSSQWEGRRAHGQLPSRRPGEDTHLVSGDRDAPARQPGTLLL